MEILIYVAFAVIAIFIFTKAKSDPAYDDESDMNSDDLQRYKRQFELKAGQSWKAGKLHDFYEYERRVNELEAEIFLREHGVPMEKKRLKGDEMRIWDESKDVLFERYDIRTEEDALNKVGELFRGLIQDGIEKGLDRDAAIDRAYENLLVEAMRYARR